MASIFFEDFQIGVKRQLGTRHVTEAEIIAFAKQFDPQPFHIDPVAARASIYGGVIASGWHTCSMVMRMMCDTYVLEAASLGSPGMEDIRWILPVRAGDTIRGEGTVLEARRSKSKPDRGVVVSEWHLYNQHDQLVFSMRGMGMFLCRTPAPAPSEP